MPDLALERQSSKMVIGIDEAGRGPWAGPVTVAAFWINPEYYDALPDGLDDSKKLSASKRARIFDALCDGPHQHAIITVPVSQIDQLGILQATLLGMRQSAQSLITALDQPPVAVKALVDGNIAPGLDCEEECVIKGDTRSCSIAAASILAKETRDQLMDQLAQQFPDYGWERNKGYGTAQHQAALQEVGVSAHHRRSFAPIKTLLSAAE